MKILESNLLSVTIVMNGMEITYDDVYDFKVKSLEQCVMDGEPIDESEIESFGCNEKFFVVKSEKYQGVFPVSLSSAFVY